MAAMMILMLALLVMGAHHGGAGTHGAQDAAPAPAVKEQAVEKPGGGTGAAAK